MFEVVSARKGEKNAGVAISWLDSFRTYAFAEVKGPWRIPVPDLRCPVHSISDSLSLFPDVPS